MGAEAPLLFEKKGAVAHLTLNRPTVGNAIDMDLGLALMKAAIACDEDESVRAVLLSANGRLFCAGGDVGAFAAAGDGLPALLKELTGYMHVAVSRLSRMRKPLVTAIQGPAAGAGLSFAVLGDIALAARSAHFTVAYTAIGLTPDGGASWLLPRLVGLRRSQELMLTNRRVSAEEAADIGLVTRVVDDEALAAEAEALAAQLAAGATLALGRCRELLLASTSATLETQMEAEARAIADGARGPEGREGVAAFLAKRKPVFAG